MRERLREDGGKERTDGEEEKGKIIGAIRRGREEGGRRWETNGGWR